MTKFSVTIEKEEDVPAFEAVLKQMGLEFEVEDDDDDDWGDLPEAAIEGIKAGIADSEAGRMHSHESVMARINDTLNQLRAKNG
jgi:hypothetical protein